MPKCELCGEPMEELESMFKYHGSLGPCPTPNRIRPPRVKSVIEYVHREADGQFWLDVTVDGDLHDSIGFDTPSGRQAAPDDLLEMMRSVRAN